MCLLTQIQDYKDVHVTGGRVAYPTASVALAALAARRGDRAAAAAEASTLHQGQGQHCCHGSHGGAVHADVHVPVTSATCESCVVTVRFMGYHRVRKGSGEAFDHVQLFLPDVQMETQVSGFAGWVRCCVGRWCLCFERKPSAGKSSALIA